MDLYINPKNGTKEEWLDTHGRLISAFDVIEADETKVCLVDNGPFTAAGICFDHSKLESFARFDGRLKTWHAVSDEKLAQFDPTGMIKRYKNA